MAEPLILWADASLNESTGHGGIAVVREDGTVERALRVVGPIRNNVKLERQAVVEATRVARRFVSQGVFPIEIRTDCTNARAGIKVQFHLRRHVWIRWMSRDANRAHHEARRAAGLA